MQFPELVDACESRGCARYVETRSHCRSLRRHCRSPTQSMASACDGTYPHGNFRVKDSGSETGHTATLVPLLSRRPAREALHACRRERGIAPLPDPSPLVRVESSTSVSPFSRRVRDGMGSRTCAAHRRHTPADARAGPPDPSVGKGSLVASLPAIGVGPGQRRDVHAAPPHLPAWGAAAAGGSGVWRSLSDY